MPTSRSIPTPTPQGPTDRESLGVTLRYGKATTPVERPLSLLQPYVYQDVVYLSAAALKCIPAHVGPAGTSMHDSACTADKSLGRRQDGAVMHHIAMMLLQIIAMAVFFCHLVCDFQDWAAVGHIANRKFKDSFLNDRRPRMKALCNSVTLWEDFLLLCACRTGSRLCASRSIFSSCISFPMMGCAQVAPFCQR